MLFTNKEWGTVEFESDGCSGTLDEVNYLEHVEVIVSIEYPVRGQLEIDLISPSGQPKFVKKSIASFLDYVNFQCYDVTTGTSTQLVKQRPKDKSQQGYVNWPFMSVHTWGEMSKGRWKLIVTDLVNIFLLFLPSEAKRHSPAAAAIHYYYVVVAVEPEFKPIVRTHR